ncbi:MAG: tRNA pseudouridine(38-40) synthase TruA [Oscillospiraceae bacterium]|nr:tRNA pseudouridine(38-40) synthase TruA [Oscillospiraceae bacterium]
MRTLKMTIAYRGTHYHGFQRQPNAPTVQGELEQQLSRVLNGPVTVYGCSRTDTGVHANEFVLHLHTERDIRCKNLVRAMNGYLPDDISVLACEDTDLAFHARFDCKGKEYLYRIHNHESKDPFAKDLAFHYRRPLDTDLIRYAAGQIAGRHDFHSFCAQAAPESNCVRTIYGTDVQRRGNAVEIRVRGDGFLYNMVRIFVGTLLDINEGVFPPDAMPQIIAAKDRLAAGRTAMAHGLYLNHVFYDAAELETKIRLPYPEGRDDHENA